MANHFHASARFLGARIGHFEQVGGTARRRQECDGRAAPSSAIASKDRRAGGDGVWWRRCACYAKGLGSPGMPAAQPEPLCGSLPAQVAQQRLLRHRSSKRFSHQARHDGETPHAPGLTHTGPARQSSLQFPRGLLLALASSARGPGSVVYFVGQRPEYHSRCNLVY